MSCRGESRTAKTSKMERFVTIVNGWKPLTIITKRSILDVAAVLDPPLSCKHHMYVEFTSCVHWKDLTELPWEMLLLLTSFMTEVPII